jgi:hypothetical protein
MDRKTRRAGLISLTALVWGAAFTASVARFKLSARSQLQVELAVTPPAVRVTVDGERQFDGAYADTPLKLLLRPGHHRFKVSRDGYVAQVFQVDGDAGDELHLTQVVLEKSDGQLFQPVEISAAAGDPPVHVEIDDGLAHGETPFLFSDLTADREHAAIFYLKWPDKEPKVRCRFTPQAPEGEDPAAPYRIRVKVKGARAKTWGCERGRDKGKKGP